MTYSIAKIIIPIQSISDVITNSSSELFCTIFSEEHLDDIHNLLVDLIGKGYSDESLSVYLECKDDDYKSEYYKDYPDYWIEIHMPYDFYNASNILRAGLEAILENEFEDGYKIVFE